MLLQNLKVRAFFFLVTFIINSISYSQTIDNGKYLVVWKSSNINLEVVRLYLKRLKEDGRLEDLIQKSIMINPSLIVKRDYQKQNMLFNKLFKLDETYIYIDSVNENCILTPNEVRVGQIIHLTSENGKNGVSNFFTRHAPLKKEKNNIAILNYPEQFDTIVVEMNIRHHTESISIGNRMLQLFEDRLSNGFVLVPSLKREIKHIKRLKSKKGTKEFLDSLKREQAAIEKINAFAYLELEYKYSSSQQWVHRVSEGQTLNAKLTTSDDRVRHNWNSIRFKWGRYPDPGSSHISAYIHYGINANELQNFIFQLKK